VQGFSSHAAAALGPLGALIDTIHLCFVVLWIGVVAAVWLDRREGADFVAHAKAVGKVAAASVTGALLTGVALFLSLTVLADRAITGLPTTYALTLVYKLVGVAALLGFGAVNQFVHLRRLGPDPTREGLLRANLRRELVNALVVLLLAAILSTLDPQLS
jgi:putative copper export protein